MLDADDVVAVDRGNMRDLIASLPDQLADGLQRGLAAHADLHGAGHIFIVGMGGSGIAGDVFTSWIADRCKAPIQSIHDYRLPSYARTGDLLVAVSYSGNTEETLAAVSEGIKLGCKLVAVTSGGSLVELARGANATVIEVPAGLPPRAAFGYLFGILPSLATDWVYGDPRGELQRALVHLKDLRSHLGPAVPVDRNRAKRLAVELKNRIPIVYGAAPYGPIAKRWQTQLNENAKAIAFSSVFPEADHNEIVGWCSDDSARRFAPIVLRDPDESAEMRRRLDATVALMSRHTQVEQVRDDDDQILGRMLGSLYLGDHVSLYLATLRKVDPRPVPPIDELKALLKGPGGKKG